MYINGVKRGERILLVDDIISTGGTVMGIMDGLRKAGCTVVQVLVAVDKSGGLEKVSERIGVPVKAVIATDLVDGRPVCSML